MSLKDIEKLRERVEKDPNSKLFIPLAEEYRKEGLLDEAVNVLLTGLEKQPGYISARVSLGKIYLEKGQMDEARAEFEQVVRAIPDNLFAHKKLAELYRDTGERDLAIKSFRNVLNLNPKDEDALIQMKDLEAIEAETPAEAAPEASPYSPAPPALSEMSPGEISFPEETAEPFPAAEMPAGEENHDDDISSFKDSLFGSQQGDEKADSGAFELPSEETIEIADDDVEPEEGLSFGDLDEHEEVRLEETADSVDTEVSDQLIVEEVKAVPAPRDMPPEGATFSLRDEEASIGKAEQCIAAGDFSGALQIYRKMLTDDPGDRKTLQRVEELRGLLKLMGKDKEALVARLNEFMEAIRKRRDEFLRRP